MGHMQKVVAIVGGVVVSLVALAAQGTATGTARYTSKKGPLTVTFTHAAAVSGTDAFSGKPMRRLVLSTTDLSATLKACDSMMRCSTADLDEGLTLDISPGEPRYGYWFVANGQLVQYSGMIAPDTLTLTTDTPTRLAGTLTLDEATAGGPVVSVTFDAAVLKALGK